jgi:precorrin-2 dehydrogenase/sirohydrochlorin ferrochelatase
MTNPIGFSGYCHARRPLTLRPMTLPPLPVTAPVFHAALRLSGQSCLVVGGGPVGARKAAALLECGAQVTVISPRTCAEIGQLPLCVIHRCWQPGDVVGYRLVITATGIAEIDREVFLDAERAGILVNAADDPVSCSFLMPAVLRRGAVSVAVSTSGVSPWLAIWLRQRIGTVLGDEVALLATIVGEARAAIRRAGISSEGLDWAGLVDGSLWPILLDGEIDLARSTARRWVDEVLAARPASPAPGARRTRE